MVPDGAGPFGHILTNRVPVADISSARLYLNHLRTPDHQPMEWRREGSQYGVDGPVNCHELTNYLDESLGETSVHPTWRKTGFI